ncbi:MAG TPA: hypothetical protein VJ767_04085 [Nitrososphaeraceae archaeon]|nr:hypothetical protein [Nitrososphaeraceae archaeon]
MSNICRIGITIDFINDQANNWKKIESEVIGDSVVTGLRFNQDDELFAYVIPKVEEETNNQNGY